MGFLGNIFKGKDQKNKEANNANKQQLLQMINNAQLGCRNAEAMGMLRKIEGELQSQSETSKEEVIRIDSELKQLISDANALILKQQYTIAMTKLNKASDLAIDRHQYCYAGGVQARADRGKTKDVAIEKTRAEQLQDQLDQQTQKLAALEKEMEQLRALHQQDPKNASVIARATGLKPQISGTKNTIANLTIELERELTVGALADAQATSETITQGRTYSDEQVDVMSAKMKDSMNTMAEAQAQSQSVLGILNMGAASMSDPFAEESAVADPFADVFGDSTGVTATQSSSNVFEQNIGSADMKRDIDNIAKSIEKSLQIYEEKIENANDELEDINMELRPLIARRKTASPSECLAIDAQIDRLNSKRNSIIYQLKAYSQQTATLNDKLAMVSKLSIQQDLAVTNAGIAAATAGQFTNFEELAMFLKSAVQKSNEELEAINIASSVADSEEFNTQSASGVSTQLNDDNVLVSNIDKDEHKYDQLEEDILRVRTF